MGVFIKGMKMPRDCYECKVWSQCFDEKPPFNMIKSVCPLVEVEEPHDDLVDRGWVRDSINHSCWLEHNDYLEAIGIIDDAPTIVEAEGREE